MGAVGLDFAYYIGAAIVRGNNDGNDICVYGFDAGPTYEADLPLYALLTLGAAHGIGGSNENDEVDRELRLTGFQESFCYYGEALAPEFSNL